MNMLAALTIILFLIPTLALGQGMAWYFNDGPSAGGYWWSDSSVGPFWEWMSPDAIGPDDINCTYTDMMTGQYYQPFWATTQLYDSEQWAGVFWAEIYFENSYPGFPELVTVTLGKGIPGLAGSFTPLASPVSVIVSASGTMQCGTLHTFTFGNLSIALNNEALILKIEQQVNTGGTTHIFWDSDCCASALFGDSVIPTTNSSWGTVKALYR
ncbi:MAG: hypothetical protein GY746_05825 [Gammaproteobacteria bacterium]|nr:hypothetical protein [Gammaproteobacteria bacterium]